MFESFDQNNENDMGKHYRKFMGPQMVDQQIRSAINSCWMMLPNEQKNFADLERHIRRLVDRALRDFSDDANAFDP